MISPVALTFYWSILKEAFMAFGKKELMIRSAALSYYTIFSLPPLLLVLLQTTSIFYDQSTIRETIFGQLSDYFGRESATTLSQTIENIGLLEQEGWSLVIGIAGVLFTATTVFVTIQGTLNKIFVSEDESEELGWWSLIRGRLVGLALLLSIAFVLLVSLTTQAILTRFIDQLAIILPGISAIILLIISLILPLLITGLLFALIFKYLPDRSVNWEIARTGAIITTLLFHLGQYGITYYIGLTNTGNMYDAAGSTMVVMVWIFYASAIFYFGALFTAIYNRKMERLKEVEPKVEPASDANSSQQTKGIY